MTAEILIDKLMEFYNVFSMHELGEKLNIKQPAISKWKKQNSVSAIKKRCRDLGIYNEIFGDLNFSSSENQEEDKTNINLSKYFIALQSVVSATNKEDELIEDIKNLMKKYIGE